VELKLLVDSAEFWSTLARDLAAARSSVRVQTLSYEADSAGTLLEQALLASPAADRRLIIDCFTLHVISDRLLVTPRNLLDRGLRAEVRATSESVQRLRRAGVGVRFTNPIGPWLTGAPQRNHKKLMAVDGRAAYFGGINFSAHNFAWRDVMVRVADADLVAHLEADFDASWHGRHQSRVLRFKDLDMHILGGADNERAFKPILAHLAEARESIFVECPYLTPPFSHALVAAARRGVDVTVVTPAKNNFSMYYHHVRGCGAVSPLQVRLYPGRMTHMKAMLVDGRTLIVGSANFDLWSYHFQQEYVAVIRDPALVADFRARVVEPDLAVSAPPDRPHPAWKGRLADWQLRALEAITLRFSRPRADGSSAGRDQAGDATAGDPSVATPGDSTS